MTEGWGKAPPPEQTLCDGRWRGHDDDDDDDVDTSLWQLPSRQSHGLEGKSFHYTTGVMEWLVALHHNCFTDMGELFLFTT